MSSQSAELISSYHIANEDGTNSKLLTIIYILDELPIGSTLAHKEEMKVELNGSVSTKPLISNCLLAAAKQVYVLIRKTGNNEHTAYYFAAAAAAKV
jgi:hypothetical protein